MTIWIGVSQKEPNFSDEDQLIVNQVITLAMDMPDKLGNLMRPTTVRFSHTNRSAMRRRSGFVSAPMAKKPAPAMTLVERTAVMASAPAKVVQAA
ncbi:hypothetical protein [Vibrio salilacus]|uniref:hypothetical protein n=1 Tax=Vibrio salilacus TaxID=1323749 RepID=UPI001561D789|nr:hypothetical protein [Vibrio salilacus]